MPDSPRSAAPQSDLPWVWQASQAEVAQLYGCDSKSPAEATRLLRAVDVAAPVGQVFAWLGNLRLAPYSYDLLDNWGRRSPRELRTDLPPLAVGDRVMTMFTTVEVVQGREITIRSHAGPGHTLFGDVTVTYAVHSAGPTASRLIAALRFGGGDGVLSRGRRYALAWGDLLMMRQQLRTLGGLAEATSTP